MSVLIRLELAAPGVQVLQGDHQLFNVIITGHAFIMSAPSHSTVDCGRTSQVVLFCVVGMDDLKSPIHLAPLPDRGEPNKTL